MVDQLRCSACGDTNSIELSVFFTPSNRNKQCWHKCKSCGAFFSPETYVIEDEIKHTEKMAWGHSQLGVQLNTYKQRLYRKCCDLLLKYLPAPANILDIGCAYGGFMQIAHRHGYRVCGYDIVPSAVSYVQSIGLEAYQCESAAAFSEIAKQPFDAAVCLDVNCYWHDQRAELTQIKKLLYPNGYLLMRVVDKSWLFALGVKLFKLSKQLGERLMRMAANDHRHSMPVRSHLKLLRELGYDVLYVSPKDALHSNQSRLVVKLMFEFGSLMHTLSGIYLAPGALILAQAE